MTFSQAVASGIQNYLNFNGRASRSAYWYWILFSLVVSLVAGALDRMVFETGEMVVTPFNGLANLALFLPTLALAVRRFHDMDRTGWWVLLGLTGIGGIILIIWFCQPGTRGSNRFGPDPLGSA
ncbi:putative inner membrane protein [Hyphomicrobiales bacterium]|nr:putative inner membrane protein [Hyphomicrobiales bacterium]CAH1675777.1 putative inner membrane protein [Hyphomicrobiales bacterium]